MLAFLSTAMMLFGAYVIACCLIIIYFVFIRSFDTSTINDEYLKNIKLETKHIKRSLKPKKKK